MILLTIVSLVFIIIKAMGYVTWSWAVALIPSYILLALVAFYAIFMAVGFHATIKGNKIIEDKTNHLNNDFWN